MLEKTPTFDRDLLRRANIKLRRYGTDVDGVLSIIVSMRGLPAVLRPVPPVIEFEVQGERFVADVTPDGGSYSAQVRGYPECYTCGDNEAELRRNLVEAAELSIFDIADKVYT